MSSASLHGDTPLDWCDSMANRSRTLSALQRARYVGKGTGRAGVPVEDRFAASFVQHAECWIWQRRPGTSGVPSMTVDGRPVTAARWAWAEMGGSPLSTNDALGSTCDTGSMCVNPSHHRIMTRSEIRRRSVARIAAASERMLAHPSSGVYRAS